ncbi:hypothetical protein Tco_0363238 [Tanacetum coccineum]
MSDYKNSTVTYTAVSSPFGGLSDIGSPGVVGPEHEGLPWMLDDPYAQFMPPEDEILPAEEQPLHAADSPTANSPGYVPESDPEEDPEEDNDEDLEEDPADYPADGGDDGDDEDEPSDDDEDEPSDDDEDEEPFEMMSLRPLSTTTPCICVTARISIPTPVPTPLWSDAEVARLLAISTPPSSPLSPWSSPLPQIPSPLLPLSPPSPVLSPAPPPSPIRSLGYRAAMIWMRVEAASTSYSLPLPPPFILSPTRTRCTLLGDTTHFAHISSYFITTIATTLSSRREDRPEERAHLLLLLDRLEVLGQTIDREIRHNPEREVGYGIHTSRGMRIVETLVGGAPVSTDTESGSTYDNIWRLGLGCIWMWLIEAWRRSMDASDLARGEVMSLRTTVLAQMSEIRELHDADRRRQAVTSEMLKADHRRGDSTTGIGDHLAGAGDSPTGTGGAYKDKVTGIYRIGYRTPGGQQGPVGGPAQPELPEEAGSSS